MAFIYQYKKTLYFNLQKNQNLHELLYIYIIYIYIYTKTNLLELIRYKNIFSQNWLVDKENSNIIFIYLKII